IADAAKPLAIAGVMGGLNSEVSDSTVSILLESAYFEAATIARTSRRLQLHSEASHRFARGIDRAGQVTAVTRVAALIAESAGAKAAGQIADVEPIPAPHREITLDLAAMEALIGASISPVETKQRLKALGAEVGADGRGRLKV